MRIFHPTRPAPVSPSEDNYSPELHTFANTAPVPASTLSHDNGSTSFPDSPASTPSQCFTSYTFSVMFSCNDYLHSTSSSQLQVLRTKAGLLPRRVECDLSVLDGLPLELLDPHSQQVQRRGHDERLQTPLLSVVVLGLRGPVQKCGHILGHLRGGGRSAVLIFHQVVKQHSAHGNGATGEVWVVVGSCRQRNTGWWLVWVPGQKRKNVVGAAVSGLDDQRQVRRQRTLVGSPGSLLVRVWSWNIVSQLSWSFSGVSLVIGLVVVLQLFAEGLGLGGRVRNTHQVSPGNSVQRMARSTNFLVNLVSSSDGGVVESGQHSIVGPAVCGRMQTVLSSCHGTGSYRILVQNEGCGQTGGSDSADNEFLGSYSVCGSEHCRRHNVLGWCAKKVRLCFSVVRKVRKGSVRLAGCVGARTQTRASGARQPERVQ